MITKYPTVLIVFGATGDLMAKKIIPSLYNLYNQNKLPKLLTIIGSARRELSDLDFQKHVRNILIEKKIVLEKTIDEFLSRFKYHRAEFNNLNDYKSLSKKLGFIDERWKACSNKLFYIAVPPQNYELLFRELSLSGLTIPCGENGGWTRVIVEKPFGNNYETAKKLDETLWKLFKEEQIYRIDHYLAKEMLQNIYDFRFLGKKEYEWSNKNIKSIDINLYETLGVEKRGAFYETVGALKDVGQNHILQLLALVTMDKPKKLTSDLVRKERAKVLKKLPIMQDSEIIKNTKRYQHKGYKNIENVSKNSKIETFFDINFTLIDKKWDGVAVHLKGGKKTGVVKKEVIINFKNSKKKITFFESRTNQQYTAEYQKLLLDCFDGNQMNFVSSEEIYAMWKFTDPIIKVWKKNLVPLLEYEPDTMP